MYLGQQQDRTSSPLKNSAPTDQLQARSGNVEPPGVVGWQIEVVAVMRRWRWDGRNTSDTAELGRACSGTS